MRVILVDDEHLALTYLEKLLAEIGGFTIIGLYTNPREVIQAVIQNKPDLIFLDINLPEVNGIDVAEQLQTILPEIHIVFITAYEEYAVTAFELNALDYLIKPVQRERLSQTIRRFSNKSPSTPPSIQSQSKIIGCFQTLHFEKGHEIGKSELIDISWRTAKARELFAYLVQHRDRYVRKDVLLELFWPDSDYKKGYAQLYSAVYQIRKMLDSLQINSEIVSLDKSYKLNLNNAKLDFVEWESELRNLPQTSKDTLPTYRKLLDAYRGDYLAEDGYLWAENERERLCTLFHDMVKKVATYYMEQENYMDAITLCQHVQTLHPHIENSYFLLMQVYAKIGDDMSVKCQYEKLSNILESEYGINISESIEKWFSDWQKQLI